LRRRAGAARFLGIGDGGNGTVRGQATFRVFIADEHPMLRKGLALSITQQGWQVVGEASTGQDAVSGVIHSDPDLAILGVEMKGMSGLDALREIKSRKPKVAVLIYTARPAFEYLVMAVESGAAGFILKDAPEEALISEIARIATGEHVLDTEWRLSILREIQAKSLERNPGENGYPLTRRELEMLQAIGNGLPTEEIAALFSLSVHTINAHVHNILKKLHVSDRTQALVWAARRKLVSFE
jgi:DNA-binding NarL/FixJ family response regulator